MRADWENTERLILVPQACYSINSRGRIRKEENCPLRTCFQRDRDRIIHSKAFRRLKQKTQVFIAPEGDHYRTRLSHTLEVMQISRTIARALKLNEDLTEAIALGHDLGHTPFGHGGERSLAAVVGNFHHNEQSLRVVDYLEENGKGLNLTFEVRDGILKHSGDNKPQTLEGAVVKIADRIAYVNHDIDDAIRAGILTEDDLPKGLVDILGGGNAQRINTMVLDTVKNSEDLAEIRMSVPVGRAMNDLREFLFEKVYRRKQAQEEEAKVKIIITKLYGYYLENTNELPAFMLDLDNGEMAVTDYIAGMTDSFALEQYVKIK
ncbi:MAG: deoxyguanosinetriphosphate triphosphohydrolase [Clostridia bacterium]|jgi:dGTPase|nr:deoxyguanosinetriphosphate triphosphohydrolase [Clostridia bacterium]MDD4571521.1 deoxyguanosinetriphosphate triphosphohydrolase [Clostridia bacterium]